MGARGPKARRREVIWTPEFAYGVGLMTSDGNLSSDGRHLECTSKDREQIENIRKCFGITAAITTKKGGTITGDKRYYRIQWGDVVLYRFFLSIGITANKSLTIGELSIPDPYFFDFLRGFYDGDGCFYSYFDPRWKNSFMFYLTFVSASKPFIAWLRGSIERLADVSGHLASPSGKNFFHLRYAKRETLLVLANMYKDPKAISLKRKKLKIVKALRIVGELLPA